MPSLTPQTQAFTFIRPAPACEQPSIVPPLHCAPLLSHHPTAAPTCGLVRHLHLLQQPAGRLASACHRHGQLLQLAHARQLHPAARGNKGIEKCVRLQAHMQGQRLRFCSSRHAGTAVAERQPLSRPACDRPFSQGCPPKHILLPALEIAGLGGQLDALAAATRAVQHQEDSGCGRRQPCTLLSTRAHCHCVPHGRHNPLGCHWLGLGLGQRCSRRRRRRGRLCWRLAAADGQLTQHTTVEDG